jgi:hypothetical protein
MEISTLYYKMKTLATLLCVMMLYHKLIINNHNEHIDIDLDGIQAKLPNPNPNINPILKSKDELKSKSHSKEIKYHLTNFTTNNAVANYEYIKTTVDLAITILSDGTKSIGGEDFMIEVAIVESDLGTNRNHIRDKGRIGGRGIMQIDEIAFLDTKNLKSHPELKVYHERLLKNGIDWMNLKWNDCNKPLYSVIAARLLMLTKSFEIAESTEERAKQWKKYYNSSRGKGTVEIYITKVENFYDTYNNYFFALALL